MASTQVIQGHLRALSPVTFQDAAQHFQIRKRLTFGDLKDQTRDVGAHFPADGK